MELTIWRKAIANIGFIPIDHIWYVAERVSERKHNNLKGGNRFFIGVVITICSLME